MIIILTIIKVFMTILSFFLPSLSVQLKPSTPAKIYLLANIPRAFGMQELQVTQSQKAQYSLSGLTLKAVYATKDNKGFILVQDLSNESFVVGALEEYKGYTLAKIYKKRAIFTKDNKEFVLEMAEDALNIYKIEPTSAVQLKNRIQKQEIDAYKKDINLIWDNISIEPSYQNGAITGFDIKNVKKNSVFSDLGLQAGDKIIAANGTPLTSIADAFRLYEQIDKIRVFKITILRNGQEKELEYEIY